MQSLILIVNLSIPVVEVRRRPMRLLLSAENDDAIYVNHTANPNITNWNIRYESIGICWQSAGPWQCVSPRSQEGWGVRQVARHMHVSPSSVCRWRDTHDQYGESRAEREAPLVQCRQTHLEQRQYLLPLLS